MGIIQHSVIVHRIQPHLLFLSFFPYGVHEQLEVVLGVVRYWRLWAEKVYKQEKNLRLIVFSPIPLVIFLSPCCQLDVTVFQELSL